MRLVLVALLVAACTSDEQVALDEARAKFETVGDYSVYYRLVVPGMRELRLEVADGGDITARFDAETGDPTTTSLAQSVESQFTTIQRAIDGDVVTLEVEYDPTLGYPTRSRIEWTEIDEYGGDIELFRDLVPDQH